MDLSPTPPGRARRLRIGATCALAVLGVAECASTPGLATGPAEELAAGADRLAAHLESEATCDAREQADALLAQAREGETAGDVPADVVDRIEYVAARVHREVPCEPEAAEATETDDDPGAEADDDPAPAQTRDNGRGDEPGEDRGKAKGRDKDKGDNGKGGKGDDGKGKG